ncbi:MAG: hypothetical protein Q9180_009326, partial [Flavoplaca navasiana]
QRWRPKDIVISKDGDCRADLLEPLNHLETLIGLSGAKNLDMMEVKLMTNLPNAKQFVVGGDDNDSRRTASRDADKAASEIIAVCQSRNDYGNISIEVRRFGR